MLRVKCLQTLLFGEIAQHVPVDNPDRIIRCDRSTTIWWLGSCKYASSLWKHNSQDEFDRYCGMLQTLPLPRFFDKA